MKINLNQTSNVIGKTKFTTQISWKQIYSLLYSYLTLPVINIPVLYLEIIIEILLARKSSEDFELNQALTESYWYTIFIVFLPFPNIYLFHAV